MNQDTITRALLCADRFISFSLALTIAPLEERHREELMLLLDRAAESIEYAREAVLNDDQGGEHE